MTTFLSERSLISKCFYRGNGGWCENGYIHFNRRPNGEPDEQGVISEPVRVGMMPVQCPACEGKAVILTERGRELMTFLDVFARPLLRDLVDELFEEREQH